MFSPRVIPSGNSSFRSKSSPKARRNSRTIRASPKSSAGSRVFTGTGLGSSLKNKQTFSSENHKDGDLTSKHSLTTLHSLVGIQEILGFAFQNQQTDSCTALPSLPQTLAIKPVLPRSLVDSMFCHQLSVVGLSDQAKTQNRDSAFSISSCEMWCSCTEHKGCRRSDKAARFMCGFLRIICILSFWWHNNSSFTKR